MKWPEHQSLHLTGSFMVGTVKNGLLTLILFDSSDLSFVV